MSDFGFAIVGCGAIARTHVRAIGEIPTARVTALVSRRLSSAEALRDEFQLHAECFDDLPAALARPGVDAVIIGTPSGAHREPALAAAAAGKHVLVEKPLEITTERCDDVIAACDRAGVQLGVIFPSRFSDANRTLKQAVEARRFGRITLAETTCKWWRPQEYYDRGDWRGTVRLDGGGALMNQAIHNVDLLLWLMGEPIDLAAFTATLAHERIEVEDTAVAVMRFASGALGVIEAATSIHPGYPKTIAVHGDRGSVVVEQDAIVRWDFAEPAPGDEAIRATLGRSPEAAGGARDPAAISHLGHRRQFEDFIQAVRANRPPEIDGREGRKSVAVIQAIYAAARTKTTSEG